MFVLFYNPSIHTRTEKENEKNPKTLPIRLVTAGENDCNLPEKSKIYIATYNVRTLSSKEKFIELSNAIRSIKYDVIGLSETRLPDCGINK